MRIFIVENGIFNLFLMGRKKKKSIEKTARKGIKKELSQQLANQLQDVFNQFGDESKKSIKAIARASKSLAKKLTPMANIDKSVIKKSMQNAYPQETRRVSSSPAIARNATARNSQPGLSKPRTAAPARTRVGSASAKGAPLLKTPMRKREEPKIAAPVVSQNLNEDRNDLTGPPPMDQT